MTTIGPTKQNYDATLAQHPWVATFDCPDCPAVEFTQFETAYRFLITCEHSKTINYQRSTYSLKHDVEDATGVYITERAYILAALLDCFSTKIRDRSCFLNIVTDARYNKMVEEMERARPK